MSGQSSDGTDRSECTDKLCDGDAKYALWMGDRFSRVREPHELMSYDDGDLHPHICENCLPRYERLHSDKGEFVRPAEKLVADGGGFSGGTEHLSMNFDNSYHGDRKACECCGGVVEYRHGTALHHTCIQCSESGCNPQQSNCEQGKQTTLNQMDGGQSDRPVDTETDRSEGGESP